MASEPLDPASSPTGENPLSEVRWSEKPRKTPFFQAIHSARYHRQSMIRQIQTRTHRRLICYISGANTWIHREDTVGFSDLLHNVEVDSPLDLLLHTGGGDIDAAEKLISMLRTKVRNSELRVIVPDYAKSAGTLMALGADTIIMSDSSELGPIDPQVVLPDSQGNNMSHSVQHYLDAYATLKKALATDPNDVSAQIMLQKLEPTTVEHFESVKQRARQLAEDHLKLGMFSEKGNWTATVDLLLNTKRWQSHGQMISWEVASGPELGLNVEYLQPQSEDWEAYWHLYCLQRLSIGDSQKLFESDYVSIVIDGIQ